MTAAAAVAAADRAVILSHSILEQYQVSHDRVPSMAVSLTNSYRDCHQQLTVTIKTSILCYSYDIVCASSLVVAAQKLQRPVNDLINAASPTMLCEPFSSSVWYSTVDRFFICLIIVNCSVSWSFVRSTIMSIVLRTVLLQNRRRNLLFGTILLV